MTTTRDDAPSSVPDEVGEASSFPAVRGMRWWAVLLLALVLTAGGVAADVLRTGSLDAIFLGAYPGGCVLAALLVQRRDLFVAMVQPPLLLAVSVPVAVAATGSLPASGGLTSTALAVGAPLINGFPAMAVTTVVCVVIGVVRIRVQRWHRSGDEAAPRREPVRAGPSGGAARDRGGSGGRDRPSSRRDDRDRREAPRSDREQAERDRRRAQERARAERDRAQAEQDRADRERRERERSERDRPRKETPRKETPRKEPAEATERRAAAQRSSPPPGQPALRSPIPPERGGPDPVPERPAPKRPAPERPAPERPAPGGPGGPRSREDRMREERLREERRNPGPPPPGVHPVRRPDDRP